MGGMDSHGYVSLYVLSLFTQISLMLQNMKIYRIVTLAGEYFNILCLTDMMI